MTNYLHEFEKRMMVYASISRPHDFAYVVKTGRMMSIIYHARKDFPLTEIPAQSMSREALVKYVQNIRQSILKWFGEEE